MRVPPEARDHEQAEVAWMEHHDQVGNQTLFPQANSYYMGDNRERREAVASSGYREIRSDSAAVERE